MSVDIKLLPQDVIHLISAGEVIDSLAAVVRELVENALDAGATRIVISLWLEEWRVRVADNGRGMTLENLQSAAFAHSTSKINHCDDLWQIKTLGFRGEALHSLATFSQLEILSRSRDEDTGGWRAVYNEQGEAIKIETVAIAPGTVVTVSDIFGSFPKQREALPSFPQQLRLIQTTLQQIALCHPQVTWQIYQNDRLWISLSPGMNSQQILPQIVRDLRPYDLHHVTLNLAETEGKIQSLIGLPDRCHRRRPDWVKVAMNGRMVKIPELEQVILSSFARTLPKDRFPVCFLHLQICPSEINWNRHPAKAEIHLKNLEIWQERIRQAIEKVLRFNPDAMVETAHSYRVGTLLKAAEQAGGYYTQRQIEPTPQEPSQVAEMGLLELRAVAQVRNTYIVAEHPGGLWLVEQHIAHERVLYEEICDRWQLVPLDPPVILEALSPAQLQQLAHIGLEVDSFGQDIFAIRTIPALLQDRPDRAEAILELSLGGDLQAAQVAVACRSAIRNGMPLSLPEMQTLLEQWQRTKHPRTCPHGRPIYLALEESSLARYFRRQWVLGKSHGITERSLLDLPKKS